MSSSVLNIVLYYKAIRNCQAKSRPFSYVSELLMLSIQHQGHIFFFHVNNHCKYLTISSLYFIAPTLCEIGANFQK